MKTVVVQGLGFVGLAMSVAVASAKNSKKECLYNVIGLDLPNAQGKRIVNDINSGKFPVQCTDLLLLDSFKECISNGNFYATTDPKIISKADYVIVDINLDVDTQIDRGKINFEGFRNAIRTVGNHIKKDALVIIETTVPPGTTEKIVYPILKEIFYERYTDNPFPLVAHSYERVMPGPNYFNSITNFWRVYSGYNSEASKVCKEFLETIINTEKYELKQVANTTASETAKIMENSYRALNIAFIDEWSKFAQIVGIDLFDVISAIKVRPTHNNIMNPGLGVGGYCLTKDPLMGMISLDQIFNEKSDFPLSKLSVRINAKMPENTLKIIFQNLSKIHNKVLVLGITYREDVGDIRFSASERLISKLLEKKLNVDCYDPLVNYSNCIEVNLLDNLPDATNYSVIVLAVKHKQFVELNYQNWLKDFKGVLIDSNNVMNRIAINNLLREGIKVKAIGRGGL